MRQYFAVRSNIDALIASMPEEPEELAPDVDGMTSPRVRLLLNRMVDLLAPCTHVEVGSFKGPTLMSSLLGNHSSEGVAFEDYSEYDEGQALREHLNRYESSCGRLTLIEGDFFTVPLARTEHPVRSLFYDGDHSEMKQNGAILRLLDAFTYPAVIIVDDWNWTEVRHGTWQGIARARFTRCTFWELPARHNWDRQQFHNGIGLFLVCR